ncbi:MAG: hypothetical protein H7839_24770 [Magnetococcus sp. YQC-5]
MTPTDLAELSAWQKAGVLAAIDETDAGQTIAHTEIVGLARDWKTDHTNPIAMFPNQGVDRILNTNDMAARIDEFHNLKDGWLDGKGVAPSTEGLRWFSGQFENHYTANAPLPCLYPTAEGGIQAEWTLGEWEVSLEVNMDTHQGEWHSLNMKTEDEVFLMLELNDPTAWHWLGEQIRQLAPP